MAWNIRMVSTYPPRRCGIGTFCRDLANALSHFTGEVSNIRVTAIDKHDGPYSIPVDLVIHQYSPASWKRAAQEIISRAKETGNRTAVIFQHEFGLDPDEDGRDGCGGNFIRIAEACGAAGLLTVVYLHTVLENPNDHQRRSIKDLAERSDGLIVTTESAIDILESPTYGINPLKLKHIDHGVRMHDPSEYDRFKIKTEYGINDVFLATSLGLLSPGKGIPHSIRAWGRFVHESCTRAQRQHLVYLIGGQSHPEFIRTNDGRDYRAFMEIIHEALNESRLVWCRTADLGSVNWINNDVVFLETFLDEGTLLKLYGATNVMILPYLNMEQISSGILADTLGSGRVAIATKFRYALELLYSNRPCPAGLVIERHARGILVDPGPPSADQIAQALDFIVFDKDVRLRMEKQAHQRGYQMRWANSAWALLQYLDFVSQEKDIPQGRGVTFLRKKASPLTVHFKKSAHIKP
ncbi:MAG: hypothetical protein LLF76_06685 [Planctomycetaceae bacterium]|nr:hypothetical protein [Planctomycetaceae bacterium]